jgi:pimeloyl-ACP methyl ester carboxylesterase
MEFMKALPLPGAGGGGFSAWPRQVRAIGDDAASCRFFEYDELGATPELQVGALLAILGADGGHLVAHSVGAVPAMLAAHPARTWYGLVLFEPACFAAARGGAHVEEHISQMDPVFALSSDEEVYDVSFGKRVPCRAGCSTQASQ